MDSISVSEKNSGVFAVAGHVGVGHVHSHSSFVQDDSAGFAVVGKLMREALHADTRIKSVTGDLATGYIAVETYEGGVGRSYARRGLTPSEIDLLENAVDEDGLFTQNIAIKVFGRMYGQGVTETPAALQGAVALAVLDSFRKKSPGKVLVTPQDYPGRIDQMAALVVDIGGLPVSLLLNINGSEGGVGPDEDNEGNTSLGSKGELMRRVGITDIPTIIVESKAYAPDLAKQITETSFSFRAQEGIDNLPLAKALAEAAKELNIPHLLLTDAMPRIEGHLSNATKAFAEKIIKLSEELKEADASSHKVSIIAELAKLISEDAGGISFMSNTLHNTARGAGIENGTAAIISLLVPESYIAYWKIPLLTPEDLDGYIKIILRAIKKYFTLTS